MAGESPDKAEQRESVAGGDGKDPRLSVLQDRVDEPTAVFKALAPRTAPEDAQGAPEGALPVRTPGRAPRTPSRARTRVPRTQPRRVTG